MIVVGERTKLFLTGGFGPDKERKVIFMEKEVATSLTRGMVVVLPWVVSMDVWKLPLIGV